MKVGSDIEDDIRRAKIFRETIGYDRLWVIYLHFPYNQQQNYDGSFYQIFKMLHTNTG
jgi:hypothetical protein